MLHARCPWFLALAALTGCSNSSDTGNGTGRLSSTATPGAGTGTPTAPKVPPKGEPDTDEPPSSALNFTNDPNAAPCTGTPGELSALSAKVLTVGTDVPLCRTVGKVMLIVNVASRCGNTRQYGPLQALYAKYATQGFYVLGFPSPQFNGQEFADEKDVSKFCTDEYKITFPLFAIGDVNGPTAQPVYVWLHAQPDGPPPNGYARNVAWNFEKFLVNRKGKVVQRIENDTAPDDPAVIAAIEEQIAKP